ncbi:uncharacterized protein LOC107044376 [Diachasma alloeum]|uniref:uncharacterized protein LOC107044376 n=1 Tax=Diachasma alloeum TaxID=454923 RepID=UPI000738296C|nr:uncharacterized protein LOC107044376 [Diachasma alloeum]
MNSSEKSSLKVTTQTANQQLLELLKKFWVQEELPNTISPSVLSKAKAECEQHFIETHQRDSTGRYIARFPFKSSPAALGDTASSARIRLEKTIRRSSADPDAHTLYKKFIEEYEVLDHMQRAPPAPEQRQTYYLPHHGVLRPDSTTTKLRVVFDASHRSSSGVSLNDILHPGPKLQIDSSDVLIWLRRHRLADILSASSRSTEARQHHHKIESGV